MKNITERLGNFFGIYDRNISNNQIKRGKTKHCGNDYNDNNNNTKKTKYQDSITGSDRVTINRNATKKMFK